MAITKLDQVKVPMKLNYGARAIVTKAAILKNRNKEMQNLLGRIKELLGEDEVLIIAKNDIFADVTRRKPDPREDIHTLKVDIDTDQWQELLREVQQTPARIIPQTTTTTTWIGGNTYMYEPTVTVGMDTRGNAVTYDRDGRIRLTNNAVPRNDIPGGTT